MDTLIAEPADAPTQRTPDVCDNPVHSAAFSVKRSDWQFSVNMKRHELEHIIRAASGITNQPNIVVIGSQALLGQFPNAPAELLVSMEADVFPKDRAELSIQIDGAIGERSLFHETFG